NVPLIRQRLPTAQTFSTFGTRFSPSMYSPELMMVSHHNPEPASGFSLYSPSDTVRMPLQDWYLLTTALALCEAINSAPSSIASKPCDVRLIVLLLSQS